MLLVKPLVTPRYAISAGAEWTSPRDALSFTIVLTVQYGYVAIYEDTLRTNLPVRGPARVNKGVKRLIPTGNYLGIGTDSNYSIMARILDGRRGRLCLKHLKALQHLRDESRV